MFALWFMVNDLIQYLCYISLIFHVFLVNLTFEIWLILFVVLKEK